MELPHTAGCLVCGRENPHGLKLALHVDDATGVVRVAFTPRPEHTGFEGVVHGGVLATVLDEAMVWAAIWAGRRLCLAAELTVRFRRVAQVGEPLEAVARVTDARARLVQTAAELLKGPYPVTTATAKYIRLPEEEHQRFCGTFLDEPSTAQAAALLRNG